MRCNGRTENEKRGIHHIATDKSVGMRFDEEVAHPSVRVNIYQVRVMG